MEIQLNFRDEATTLLSSLMISELKEVCVCVCVCVCVSFFVIILCRQSHYLQRGTVVVLTF